jgi:hypothetical protein
VLSAVSMCGCDPAARVTPGTTEKDVRGSLGEPSWVVTERRSIEGYLVSSEVCAKVSVKVLVYDRWLRSDALVGINAQGMVACRVGGRLLNP